MLGDPWLGIRLNLRKGEQFSPQCVWLNPKVVHDGVAIFCESSAIHECPEDRIPDARLTGYADADEPAMRQLVEA